MLRMLNDHFHWQFWCDSPDIRGGYEVYQGNHRVKEAEIERI